MGTFRTEKARCVSGSIGESAGGNRQPWGGTQFIGTASSQRNAVRDEGPTQNYFVRAKPPILNCIGQYAAGTTASAEGDP